MTPTENSRPADAAVWQDIQSQRDSYVAARDINIQFRSFNDLHMHSCPGGKPERIGNILPRIGPLVGRKSDLQKLANLLDPSPDSAPNVTLVTGQPGIGKTMLAIHAVRMAVEADRVSTDVLFADLRGHDPDSSHRLTSSGALEVLLRQLGFHGDEIPPEIDSREVFFHTILAEYGSRNHHLIILADNVADYSDVRPLLPRTRLHSALITSRYTMPELNGTIIELDVLPMGESLKLLRKIVKTSPARRGRLDRHSLEKLASLCGSLPLALCLAAGRLVIEPHLALTDLIDELSTASDHLKGLAVGERAVLVAFQTSYERLTADQARMVRLLVLQHGPQFSVHMIAAAFGNSNKMAQRIMAELCRAHLVIPGTVSGFYSVHDLIYSFAAELVEAENDVGGLAEAGQRLFKYWFDTAMSAASHLEGTVSPDTPSGPFASHKESLAWMDLVSSSMVPVARMAYEAGHTGYAILLGPSFSTYLVLRRRFSDLYEVNAISVTAVRELKERSFKDGGLEHYEAEGLNEAGTALREMRRYEDAISAFEQSRRLFESISDERGVARTVGNLGITYELMGRTSDAIKYHIDDARICRRTGDLRGYTAALTNLGLAYNKHKQLRNAIRTHRRACKMAFSINNNDAEIKAINALGISYHDIERHDKAARCHRRAKNLCALIDDDYQLAVSCVNLGGAEWALGNEYIAIQEFEEAKVTFERFGDSDSAAKMATNLKNMRKIVSFLSYFESECSE
jgi:tetratricopeptide (TPR) repeat protein